jgi:hypothetical protein
MLDIALKSQANLSPLDSGLSPEVLDWARALRRLWEAIGLSINRFAQLHPMVDKGTVSRYLNGKRVPTEPWFLDQLLAILSNRGRPVTEEVREHLKILQLAALQAAHPHEFRVRQIRDQLEIAQTSKVEAERFARALEAELAERNRRIQDLVDDKRRLRAAWDADRVAMQAEYDRLTREIGEISEQLRLAQERATCSEWRCQQLEELLSQMDKVRAPDGTTAAPFYVTDPDAVASHLAAFRDVGSRDQVLALSDWAATHLPVDDVRKTTRLLTVMRDSGAIEQAGMLAMRAAAQRKLELHELRKLEVRDLVSLLKILNITNANDLVIKLADDAVSCAWRGTRDDVETLQAVLRAAGAHFAARKLAEDRRHRYLHPNGSDAVHNFQHCENAY